MWGNKPLARKIGSNYYYYLYNGHGDVIALSDESGNIVNSYDYDEWGNLTSESEQIANPIRYAGEYYDNESGLYYLRARYYDPVLGRFTSKDSVEGDITNPLSLNLYTYVENNPIIYLDPSGLSAATAEWSVNQYIYLNNLLNSSDPGVVAWADAQLKANNCYQDEYGVVFTNDQVLRARHPEWYQGTKGYGINAQIAAGPAVGVQVQYVNDKNGDNGVAFSVITPFTGGGTPSAGVSVVRSTTNTNSIESLEGWTTNFGGSGTISVFSVGEEVNIGDDYIGQTTSIGGKISPPLEVHGNRSHTWMPIKWRWPRWPWQR